MWKYFLLTVFLLEYQPNPEIIKCDPEPKLDCWHQIFDFIRFGHPNSSELRRQIRIIPVKTSRVHNFLLSGLDDFSVRIGFGRRRGSVEIANSDSYHT